MYPITEVFPSSCATAGRLRQKLCWNVVRILSTKVSRELPNTVYTADFLRKIENAAKKMIDEDGCCEDLNMREVSQARKWIADLKALRKELSSKHSDWDSTPCLFTTKFMLSATLY